MTETKITADELLSGQGRMRQGGDANDFTIPGTNNYTEERKNMQSFFGSAMSTSGTVTVTFPTPFDTPPFVMGGILGSTLGTPSIKTITTTNFTFQANNLLGVLSPNLTVLWYAVGRRPTS